MTTAAALFWLSGACVAYTYAGYPFVLILLSTLQQLRSDWRMVGAGALRRVAAAADMPPVAVLIAAHNEEMHIAERVRNLLEQDYPPELLTVYVGSDASTDRTVETLQAMACARVRVSAFTSRRGKPSVVNDLVILSSEPVLIFTDANTYFEPNTVRQLVRHFDRPEVGCACGELRLLKRDGSGENMDHIYWRYERILKFFENRIGALLGANGGVYALRRTDHRPIPGHAIVDDFWLSMNVLEAGRRCVYDPEAVACEHIPDRIHDEFRRRVRIGMGNYQAMVRYAGLLAPRHGVVALAFFSHKLLRWFVPHCMVLGLVCNLVLCTRPLYAGLLLAQSTFYGAAAAGWWCARTGRTPRLLRIPLFFVSMNLGLLLGFWKFVRGDASAVWTPSDR